MSKVIISGETFTLSSDKKYAAYFSGNSIILNNLIFESQIILESDLTTKPFLI